MTVRESQNKQYFRNCAGSGPEAVDVHVGALVRQRRTMLGISQGRLGEALGLTFQQVQKYERGVNRISAGRLYHISVILDVPINYFFEGISPAVWKHCQRPAGQSCKRNMIMILFLSPMHANWFRHITK